MRKLASHNARKCDTHVELGGSVDERFNDPVSKRDTNGIQIGISDGVDRFLGKPSSP